MEKKVRMTKFNGIHYADRTIEKLEVGNHYYISFDGKKTKDVKLIELTKDPDRAVIEIISGKGKGNIHVLFLDEVRSTIDDAKLNCVTF